MRRYIGFLGILFFCNFSEATGPSCDTNNRYLEERSLEHRSNFEITSERGDVNTKIFLNLPKEMHGKKLETVQVTGREYRPGEYTYYFVAVAVPGNDRLKAQFDIVNEWMEGSNVYLSYGNREGCPEGYEYELTVED